MDHTKITPTLILLGGVTSSSAWMEAQLHREALLSTVVQHCQRPLSSPGVGLEEVLKELASPQSPIGATEESQRREP